MTLIKSGWKCGDAGTLMIGIDIIGISLDECDTLCKDEPLCVWFMYKISDKKECKKRK